MKTQYHDIPVYTTKDGSLIRELLHPDHHAVLKQSLAEATVPPGVETHLHCHQQSEELYHITQGEGWMTLGGEQFAVSRGDSIVIAPGTPHCIRNTGESDLKILCSCTPPYRHGDTELL